MAGLLGSSGLIVLWTGPLARVGPNDLVAGDAAVIRRMMAVRSPYTRSEWYVGVRFDPVTDNVASMRDEKKHNELRAMMAAGVSRSRPRTLRSTSRTPH